LGDPLHQRHPAVPGEHHPGALLLGHPRRGERDRRVGDDPGDEQPLPLDDPQGALVLPQRVPFLIRCRLADPAAVADPPVGPAGAPRARAQCPMPRPPSTGMTAPVMYAAASPARNVTTAATSSGVAIRPSGTCPRISACRCSSSAAVMAVATKPG